jgi:threonylcarbamoyladenosine tRNA methylthiotransferase MtaB
MKRKYNRKMALDGIARLKKAFPDATFTADIIVGFPGETDEDFAETLSFAEKVGFFNIHIFKYSIREGTSAASMQQVPADIKNIRANTLSSLRDKLRNTVYESLAADGKPRTVIFEKYRNGILTGHTEEFAEISAPGDKTLRGKSAKVVICSATGNARIVSYEGIGIRE